MKPMIFHGYSDDTFGEYGRTRDDHDNCASGKPIRFRVQSGVDALDVVGQYSPGNSGAWLVGVEAIEPDNGQPLPAWPMRLRQGTRDECEHSTVLEIDAPEDATVTYVPNRGER